MEVDPDQHNDERAGEGEDFEDPEREGVDEAADDQLASDADEREVDVDEGSAGLDEAPTGP